MYARLAAVIPVADTMLEDTVNTLLCACIAIWPNTTRKCTRAISAIYLRLRQGAKIIGTQLGSWWNSHISRMNIDTEMRRKRILVDFGIQGWLSVHAPENSLYCIMNISNFSPPISRNICANYIISCYYEEIANLLN